MIAVPAMIAMPAVCPPAFTCLPPGCLTTRQPKVVRNDFAVFPARECTNLFRTTSEWWGRESVVGEVDTDGPSEREPALVSQPSQLGGSWPAPPTTGSTNDVAAVRSDSLFPAGGRIV